jgi:hypothetical protein
MQLTFRKENGSSLYFIQRPTDPNTKWVLGDYELLGTPFARARGNVSGQPHTVNLVCRNFGMVPASDDYKRITKGLNPGLSDAMMADMMNKWMPAGAKWGIGEDKVALEIIFANNPINTLGLIPNPGGLTGIPAGAMIHQLDMLDYQTLFMYDAATIPQKYIMHFTVNVNGANVVNPDNTLGGRYGIPLKLLMTSISPMYIRAELLDDLNGRKNRYSPPWEKGIIG